MKRSVLLVGSLLFSFGAMCSGVVVEEPVPSHWEQEPEPEPEPAPKAPEVVPIPNGDPNASCCRYEDDDGAERYTRADGPSVCAEKYAEQAGKWITDIRCTEVCCVQADGNARTSAGSCIVDEGRIFGADDARCAEKEPAEPAPAKPEPTPKPGPRANPRPRPRAR